MSRRVDPSEDDVDPSEGGSASAPGNERQGDEASDQAAGDGPNEGQESAAARGINPVQHSE